MSKKELFKRYALFIISLFIAGMGVAFTKKAELGMSPTSSVANVLSLKFTFFSLGNWLIVWNCFLILGQILMLGKKFQYIQLLQIPLSFLFGYFTDFGTWCLSHIEISEYIVRFLFVLTGTTILGFGVSLSVIANVVMNSAEAFIKVVSDKTNYQFGNLKIAFDVSCVIISVTLSLLFFSGKIRGTREGTIIAAVLTGLVVKLVTRFLKKPLDKYLTKK